MLGLLFQLAQLFHVKYIHGLRPIPALLYYFIFTAWFVIDIDISKSMYAFRIEKPIYLFTETPMCPIAEYSYNTPFLAEHIYT